MIRKDLGDIRALTLIRVVLERTEDEELRNQLEEYLQNMMFQKFQEHQL